MCEKIVVCILLSSVCSLSHARREDRVVVRFVRARVIYYPPPDVLKQRRARNARRIAKINAIERRKAILIARKEQRERNERISRVIRTYKFRKLVQEQNKTPVPQEKNQFRNWKIIYSRKGPEKDDYREWKESSGYRSRKRNVRKEDGLRTLLDSLYKNHDKSRHKHRKRDDEDDEDE